MNAICFKLFKYLKTDIFENATAIIGIRPATSNNIKLFIGIKNTPIININKIASFDLESIL
jgi:hypothetical protein